MPAAPCLSACPPGPPPQEDAPPPLAWPTTVPPEPCPSAPSCSSETLLKLSAHQLRNRRLLEETVHPPVRHFLVLFHSLTPLALFLSPRASDHSPSAAPTRLGNLSILAAPFSTLVLRHGLAHLYLTCCTPLLVSTVLCQKTSPLPFLTCSLVLFLSIISRRPPRSNRFSLLPAENRRFFSLRYRSNTKLAHLDTPLHANTTTLQPRSSSTNHSQLDKRLTWYSLTLDVCTPPIARQLLVTALLPLCDSRHSHEPRNKRANGPTHVSQLLILPTSTSPPHLFLSSSHACSGIDGRSSPSVSHTRLNSPARLLLICSRRRPQLEPIFF